jgi:hypothetical protein
MYAYALTKLKYHYRIAKIKADKKELWKDKNTVDTWNGRRENILYYCI